MSVSLQKGGNVSLTKEAGGHLTKLHIGCGWDARQTTGAAFDLDASALGLTKDPRKVLSEKYFVFWGNLSSPCGAITHQGDNLTGAGDGDDEVMVLDLANMPAEINEILFAVTIYEGKERGQNFGDVENAFIRAVDATTGTELARFDLTEDGGGLVCVVFGAVYRNPNDASDWKLKAIEAGYDEGLAGLARHYGVPVS